MAFGNSGVDLSKELEGFDDMEVLDRKPKLRAGPDGSDYVLKVERITVNDGQYGKNLFAECEVVQSSGSDANPPGTMASFKVKLSGNTKDQREMVKKNLKLFAAALLDEPVSAVKLEETAELWSDDQPAKGQMFRVRSEQAKTKAGVDWIKNTPSAYRGK